MNDEIEVKLIKEPDDPICTRISAGGDKKYGYYCVVRGELQSALNILKHCIKELEKNV